MFIFGGESALEEIDNISHFCIQSGEELWFGILDYGEAVQDWLLLVLNTVYHTEHIYEIIMYLIETFKDVKAIDTE